MSVKRRMERYFNLFDFLTNYCAPNARCDSSFGLIGYYYYSLLRLSPPAASFATIRRPSGQPLYRALPEIAP